MIKPHLEKTSQLGDTLSLTKMPESLGSRGREESGRERGWGEEKNEVWFRYRRRWDEAQRGQKF